MSSEKHNKFNKKMPVITFRVDENLHNFILNDMKKNNISTKQAFMSEIMNQYYLKKKNIKVSYSYGNDGDTDLRSN